MSDRDDDTRDDRPVEGSASEGRESPEQKNVDETRQRDVAADGEQPSAAASATTDADESPAARGVDADAEGSESVPDDALGAGELDDAEADKLRDLLRGALDEREEPAPDSRFLKGVQRRLRERSGGKFYADGWSTVKHPPIGTFFVTSFIMLLVLFAVYTTLTSLVGEAVDVDNTPAPVRIVFPKQQR